MAQRRGLEQASRLVAGPVEAALPRREQGAQEAVVDAATARDAVC